MLTAGAKYWLTVMEIALEFAVAGLTQVALEVITQYTRAPLVRVVVEYVGPVPINSLFTNH